MLDAETDKEFHKAHSELANTIGGLNTALRTTSQATGGVAASEGHILSKQETNEYMQEWADWMNAPLGSPIEGQEE